jgi:hypothetical protein
MKTLNAKEKPLKTKKSTIYKAKNNQTVKIYSYHLNISNDGIIDTIYNNISNRERETNVKADLTGWHLLGCEELKQIVKDLAYKQAREHYHREYKPIRVTECWGIVYNKGDYAKPHNHYGNIWSGVYYPKLTDSSGVLVFPDLNIRIKPEVGKLLLWESYIRHEVTEVIGERLAISFNMNHAHE